VSSKPVSQTREPESDRLGREAFISLYLLAARLTGEVEATCKADGLTMSHYTVLWVLCLSEPRQGVPMGVVADGLLTRAADATRLVDRLVRDGLVERAPSEEDRRVVLVRPTRAGRSLFRRLTTRVKELHRTQWSALSPGELRQLRGLLVKALWGEQAGAERHPLEALPPASL
jgi:DNA-binding MarR family transcriptional regulator